MDELKNKKILIVDDEKELLSMIRDMLCSDGYSYIYTAADCTAALKIFNEQHIALCVLDVNLPDGNGFDLFAELKAVRDVPAIFLTARGDTEDKLKGLGIGADDYIVKPFLTAELLLRISALLRRTYSRLPQVSTFKLSDRTVDFETAQIVCKNKSYSLTAKEFILLKKLYENKNRIVTNDALCMAAWGDTYYGYENTLMVHIRRLRKKLEENPSSPKHLITARGLGYKLVIYDE